MIDARGRGETELRRRRRKEEGGDAGRWLGDGRRSTSNGGWATAGGRRKILITCTEAAYVRKGCYVASNELTGTWRSGVMHVFRRAGEINYLRPMDPWCAMVEKKYCRSNLWAALFICLLSPYV